MTSIVLHTHRVDFGSHNASSEGTIKEPARSFQDAKTEISLVWDGGTVHLVRRSSV